MKMLILLVASVSALGSCAAAAPGNERAPAVTAVVGQASATAIAATQPGPAQVATGGAASALPLNPGSSPRPIGYAALKAALEAPGSTVLLLDVRTMEEYAAGHLPGAVLAPYDAIRSSFSEPDRKRPIVVYCRSGRRSAVAAETLASMGYTDVSDFGAVDNWKGPLKR